MMEIQQQIIDSPHGTPSDLNQEEHRSANKDQIQHFDENFENDPEPIVEQRPPPTLQQLQRRKKMRRRQREQREANQFLKQPVLKIPNINKNLKRAYDKGHLDESKYDYIHILRKLRRHPEQDSMSSYYGTDEQYDIKEHLPKRGFQKRKVFNNEAEFSDSDSERQARKKKVRKPRLNKPKVKKQNIDENGQPVPKKPRKPREPRAKTQPTFKIAKPEADKPKRETKEPAKIQIKDLKNANKKMVEQEEQSEQSFQQSDNSKSDISSQLVKNEKQSKEAPKITSVTIKDNKVEVQQKKKEMPKPIPQKQVPIVQQPVIKKVNPPPIVTPSPPNPIISKNNLLPPQIKKRGDQLNKNIIKKLKEVESSSSDSSSSSSLSSSSASDSSSDKSKAKKKKKHRKKSKKHRDSSSQSSEDDKKKKKHKKHKYDESETVKEKIKTNQIKQPIQIEKPKNKVIQQVLEKTEKVIPQQVETQKKEIPNVTEKLTALKVEQLKEQKIPIPNEPQRKIEEIRIPEQNKGNRKESSTSQLQKKPFTLSSSSMAISINQNAATINDKPNVTEKSKSKISMNNNVIEIKQDSKMVGENSNQGLHQTKLDENIRQERAKDQLTKQESPQQNLKRDSELKFDPKVVVLTLMTSATAQPKPSEKSKEKPEKPIIPARNAKPKEAQIQQISDDSSASSYVQYRKQSRYPRQKLYRYRKVIVASESESSSSEDYVQRRVIKRVKKPSRLVASPLTESEESMDYRRVSSHRPRQIQIKSSKGQR